MYNPSLHQSRLHRTFADNWEHCPSCYNAQGPDEIKKRALEKTDPSFLGEYGVAPGEWPLITAWEKGELAPNGNYLEPEAISVRHGVCGDPGQVCLWCAPWADVIALSICVVSWLVLRTDSCQCVEILAGCMATRPVRVRCVEPQATSYNQLVQYKL